MTIPKIILYSTKSLLDGIYKTKKPLNFITMKTPTIPQAKANIPLSCFSRTYNDDIVLYRGLSADRLINETAYEKSVAAIIGKSFKEILAEFGNKTKALINCFSGLTQGNDPIIHTTTKRAIAKRFTRGNGVLIEYHIPKNFLRRRGFVGNLGEEEIDFIHSIPKKYVARVTQIRPEAKPIITTPDTLPPPPSSISIL